MMIASDYIAAKSPVIDEISDIIINQVNVNNPALRSSEKDNNNNDVDVEFDKNATKQQKIKLKVKVSRNDLKLSLKYFKKYIEQERESLKEYLQSIENLEESEIYEDVKSCLLFEFTTLHYPSSLIEKLDYKYLYDQGIEYLEHKELEFPEMDDIIEDDLFYMFENVIDDRFDSCVLITKSNNGINKKIKFEKPQLTNVCIHQIVKSHYPDVGTITYEKDGVYYTLNKSTFNDFVTSCTVKKKIATYYVYVLQQLLTS
eukprot:TRINITY_DN2195_c0_g1_i1.p1 TRINITY_DN2195_c0_g1~~TRINITY_DN2195_c0_g1_i1.p1  ORF type:complete len:258 (-),score=63.42 TRINITY_DN2195_c0_g1_i1:69-842(-)